MTTIRRGSSNGADSRARARAVVSRSPSGRRANASWYATASTQTVSLPKGEFQEQG